MALQCCRSPRGAPRRPGRVVMIGIDEPDVLEAAIDARPSARDR
jgi:hypothetical protein